MDQSVTSVTQPVQTDNNSAEPNAHFAASARSIHTVLPFWKMKRRVTTAVYFFEG